MKVYILFSFCAIVFSGEAESHNLNNHHWHDQLNNWRGDLVHIGREGLPSNNPYHADNSHLWSNNLHNVGRQGHNHNLNLLRSNNNHRFINDLDHLNHENYKLLLNGLNVGRQGRSDNVHFKSADNHNLLNNDLARAGRQGNNAPYLDHLDDTSEELAEAESRFGIGIHAGINAGPNPYPPYPPSYPVQPVPVYAPVPVYG